MLPIAVFTIQRDCFANHVTLHYMLDSYFNYIQINLISGENNANYWIFRILF